MRAFALLFPLITIASSLKSLDHGQPFCPASVQSISLAFILGSYSSDRDRHCCSDWSCYGDTFKIKHQESDRFLVAGTDSNLTDWSEGI